MYLLYALISFFFARSTESNAAKVGYLTKPSAVFTARTAQRLKRILASVVA